MIAKILYSSVKLQYSSETLDLVFISENHDVDNNAHGIRLSQCLCKLII